MKKTLILAASLVVFAACKNDKEATADGEVMVEDTVVVDVDTLKTAANGEYASFGDKIVADNALSQKEMLEKYSTLKAGDTIDVKFKSTVKNVCQKKGCWMTLEMPDEKESFVRFKDYGFFVPLNAGDREAVVDGKAFVSEISVAELKHYAKDEGKSQAEIDKITEPKITYGFEADGVLILQ